MIPLIDTDMTGEDDKLVVILNSMLIVTLDTHLPYNFDDIFHENRSVTVIPLYYSLSPLLNFHIICPCYADNSKLALIPFSIFELLFIAIYTALSVIVYTVHYAE